jgi:hypothetical protein
LSTRHHTPMVCVTHQAHQFFDQGAAVLTPEAGACQPLPTKSRVRTFIVAQKSSAII